MNTDTFYDKPSSENIKDDHQYIFPGTAQHPKSLNDLITENRNSKIFDADDITYLVNHFDTLELREIIKSAWYRFEWTTEWREQFYWVDLINASKLAIKILRAYEIKPLSSSNHYQPIDIERLKNSIDIREVAERYTHISKNKGLCPFHSEKTPSFFINPDKQTWHCFGACNTGGDVLSLVMKAENVDFKGAIAILGGN